MSGKNFIVEFFKKHLKGKNFIDLPEEIFKKIKAPDDLVLVSPKMFDNIIERNGILIQLPNVPMIQGVVEYDCHGYKKGDSIIYNKEYISFMYYTCIATNEIKIGLKPHQILFKKERIDE